MSQKFYITTTIPYVNGDPHVGFAREIVVADVIARYHSLLGNEVKFNTGTDEHGQKIYEKARELGKDPQAYTDELAPRFERLGDVLDLSFTNFIRTTNPHHKSAAGELWRRCDKNGYIYKGKHKIKYCVGCELEKTDSELENDKCQVHPNKELETREEENYFFKFSAFQKPLLDLYSKQPDFVLPTFRMNEIKSFVERGLQDFSISRLAEKMPWGVPVPDDPGHVMYVWFDALVNYISTLGWPEKADFDGFWPGIQVCGKDNLRQQGAMWQAMLMAAGLPNSKQIIVLGFITGDGGVKMSKSLGNVIDPAAVSEKYGKDILRYFLLRELSQYEDSPFTIARLEESYNAHLANGLGNLASRIMKMAETHLSGPVPQGETSGTAGGLAFESEFTDLMAKYEIQKSADYVWVKIGELDQEIQKTEPFKLVKSDPDKAKELISEQVKKLYTIARMLSPILPATSQKIKDAIKVGKSFATPLFPRRD